MVFDPFNDFETRGYLRNREGSKDLSEIAWLEHVSFDANLNHAFSYLRRRTPVDYRSLLYVHKILFDPIYPWAGKDRNEVAPDVHIVKSGMTDLFAPPSLCRRAAEYGLNLGNAPQTIRELPGKVMGTLAHAHPFLDGNGRTIMVVHSELCRRAGFHIDWDRSVKGDYLAALTVELQSPGAGHLDSYLAPFLVEGQQRLQQRVASLKRTHRPEGN